MFLQPTILYTWDQDHPQEKETQKAKWVSEEALQTAVKRREVKGFNTNSPNIYPSVVSSVSVSSPGPSGKVSLCFPSTLLLSPQRSQTADSSSLFSPLFSLIDYYYSNNNKQLLFSFISW